MTTNLKGKGILHGNQFPMKDIDAILRTASFFEKEAQEEEPSQSAKGKDSGHPLL